MKFVTNLKSVAKALAQDFLVRPTMLIKVITRKDDEEITAINYSYCPEIVKFNNYNLFLLIV